MPQSSLCDAIQDIRNRTVGLACRNCDLPMDQSRIKSQPNDVSTINRVRFLHRPCSPDLAMDRQGSAERETMDRRLQLFEWHHPNDPKLPGCTIV